MLCLKHRLDFCTEENNFENIDSDQTDVSLTIYILFTAV